MPTFEQSVTVAAIFAGPVGVWLGWWLNGRGASKMAEAAERAADETRSRERALETVGLARRLASACRSLTHGYYLRGTGPTPVGLDEMVDEFNHVRGDYRAAVLALRVMGPSWAVARAKEVEVWGQRFTALVMQMQTKLLTSHIDLANEGIPEMDRCVDEFVAELSRRYNPDAGALPPRRDLEVEGRPDV